MDVEENDEVILTQEREFKPTEGFEDWVDEEEAEQLSDQSSHDAENQTSGNGSSINMQILIPLIIVGVVIMILLVVILGKNFKKKPTEEDYQHLDDMLSSDVEETFRYETWEIEALRKAGYTGYEIEDYQFAEIDAEYLIEDAAEQRKAQYEAEIVPYLEASSDEFKNLMNKTWVGMDEFEINGEDAETWSYVVGKYNVDYEKIGARGMQCFIKLYFDDGSSAFITLPPDRYAAIAQKGNMLVELKECIMSNGMHVIVEAKEVAIY